ncbi:alpha-ketoglutarate-dependent dioxygenase AlkB [Ralstonia sp. Ralssp110]|uniref:alpha-ketoglutarate-dependent dioxygenase AlkB n=1 Tax=Ralstonia sp. Ralssp110 TaxID=3243004 RepID=UPI0039B57866
MTRVSASQMDWLSPLDGEAPARLEAGTTTRPRLAVVLDSRDWLRFLADEWWSAQTDFEGITLGVDAACDEVDRGKRISVVGWIDPVSLPPLVVPIYRGGEWVDGPVQSVGANDLAIRWPGPIPLAAVSRFTVAAAEDRARILAMAKGFSNVNIPSQPIEVQEVRHARVHDVPSLKRVVRVPQQWNALRGAAAMAMWAVPAIDPWLNVLCESLSIGSEQGSTATALRAPWLADPVWGAGSGNFVSAPLWAAMREIISAVNVRHEWRPGDVLGAIVESALDLGGNKDELSDLFAHTRALLSDTAIVDVKRGERDPLGLALQLVLLRPKAEDFVGWRGELAAMPPAVWWTGAVISGLLTGLRDLEPQFRGSAATRQLLAVRTWHLSSPVGMARDCWPDDFAPVPTWAINGDRVHFLERGQVWAERKTSRRGDWFRADFEHESTRQQAIDLARRLYPEGLRRCLRLADVELNASGEGRLSADKAGHRLRVKGAVTIDLGKHISIVDDLDVDRFRDWLAVGSVADRLPPVPRADAVQSARPAQAASEVHHRKLAVVRQADDPPGLLTVPDFITAEEECSLLAAVDRGTWLTDLARRVQHYGWKYDYKARKVEGSAYLGQLPEWAERLAHRLLKHGLVPEMPDQVIVNEYLGNQGIAKHVDCLDCFSGPVVTISLNESWGMVFRNESGTEKVERILQRRSAVILDNEVRHTWTHEIPKRKKEGAIIRERRVSLTFRKVTPAVARSKATVKRAAPK